MSITALVFLLFFAAGLGAALFLRPMYGLYTYIAVFYLHPPSRWWGASLPDLRWALLAAVVTLLALFVHRDSLNPAGKWYSSKAIIFLGVYVFWMWLQWVFVISPYHSLGVILFSKYMLLIFLIYTIVDNEKDFLGFCTAHVVGCAYFGYLVLQAPDTGRLEGVGGPGVDDANTLGMHLGTGLMFASFLLLRYKGYARWLILLAIPLILNGVFQTETRGAFVGIFLGGVVTIYLKPKSIRKTYYSLVVLAVVSALFVVNESLMTRLGSMGAAVSEEQEWDNSATSRVFIAQAQLQMFADYPLGVGHQGTAFLSRGYLETRWLAGNSGDRASHNTVMSVLVDQGLPGIILFFLICLSAVSALGKMKQMDKKGLNLEYGLYRTMLGGALVTIIASGMFAQYLKAEVQIWCLVLLVILYDLSKKNISKPPLDGVVSSNVDQLDYSSSEKRAWKTTSRFPLDKPS